MGDNRVTVGRWRRATRKAWRPTRFTEDLLDQPLMQSQVLGSADGAKTSSRRWSR
jgi:hypothetical protein